MKIFLITLMSIALISCGSIDPSAPASITPSDLIPTQTLIPLSTDVPIPADTGWLKLPGSLEYRELQVTFQNRSDRLRLARVDPQRFSFRVLYAPNQPRRVGEWLDSNDALQLVVNGGYFDPSNHALGLLIGDGISVGRSYQGFGGMFAVNSAGSVQIRWNIQQPYVEGEGLKYALQNYPMMIIPGGGWNDQIDDNGEIAPRSIVGQDRSGRIIFIVSPNATFTLTGMSQWLSISDLDLNVALNLDGGTSSGMLLRDGDRLRGLDSWRSVPDVIAVEGK
jgi:exopolysaccharide biosynthesis protein